MFSPANFPPTTEDPQMLNTLKKLLWPQSCDPVSKTPATPEPSPEPAFDALAPAPLAPVSAITSLLGHGWTARYTVGMQADLSAAHPCLFLTNGKNTRAYKL